MPDCGITTFKHKCFYFFMCGSDKHSSLVLVTDRQFSVDRNIWTKSYKLFVEKLLTSYCITSGSLIMLKMPALAINLWLVLQVFKVPIKKLHSCSRTVIFTVSLLENGNKTKNLHFL